MISPRPWRLLEEGGEKLIVDKRGVAVAHYLLKQDGKFIETASEVCRYWVRLRTTGQIIAATRTFELATYLVDALDAEYEIEEIL